MNKMCVITRKYEKLSARANFVNDVHALRYANAI